MRAPVLALALLPGSVLVGQTAPDTWWVKFTDKANTPYSIDAPEAFLGQRALDRRAAQGIPVDELDLPIDPAYISAVLALGDVQLRARSRWFNAITVRVDDPAVVDAIAALPFVETMRGTRSMVLPAPNPSKMPPQPDGVPQGGGGPYGPSFNQVAMMNGHLLHAMGAEGQGMLIGVLDSGFEGADLNFALAGLYARNGVIGTHDMVDQDGDVYQDHWHGRSVLSCMAGIVPNMLIGTAPLADYVLVRTETVDFELVIEEDLWVAGAEWCDSIGVDILNTSLGYTTFDDSTQDHTYADLDGLTTRISIAQGIAARKGMIPVTSAGNQGTSDWFHISAPADAIDILAVGAVGGDSVPAPFSGHGPSADGRVKPDVSAKGLGTIGLGADGTEVTGINGTSFSAPLVAGLVACLWQRHPGRTASEVMAAVRESASHWAEPDPQLGYGIPNFMLADGILELSTPTGDRPGAAMVAFPVPFNSWLEAVLPGASGTVRAALFDGTGREVWNSTVPVAQGGRMVLSGGGLEALPPGPYVLQARHEKGTGVLRVMKAW